MPIPGGGPDHDALVGDSYGAVLVAGADADAVVAALREIAMEQGGMNADAARDWMVALARQGRYQRDVY